MSSKNSSYDLEPGRGITSQECEEAIALAEEFLPAAGVRAEAYKLITAENMSTRGGDYRGPQYWHLTFKLRELIPDDLEVPVGAGGEIFIEVDLTNRKTSLAGYGE